MHAASQWPAKMQQSKRLLLLISDQQMPFVLKLSAFLIVKQSGHRLSDFSTPRSDRSRGVPFLSNALVLNFPNF